MPDPSQPAPANFFRSQSALLGTAGLVSGLNPAQIKHDTRGKTARNPIIISEDCPPRVPGISEQLEQLNLPIPTSREIVYTLIRQKNIFPVLASILKLVAKGQSQTSSPARAESQQQHGRPTKRRKLRNVPAGAADWDIPFPFKEDEGPEAYRENWEKERGKQLMSQLVSIIKSATQKAAARSFVEREGNAAFLQLVGKDYNPRYYMPGTMSARGPVVLKDSSNGKAVTPSPEPSLPPPIDTSSGQSSELNDLLMSLLAAHNEVPKTASTDHVDPALFDSWMSIFQSFPGQTATAASDDPFAFLSAPAPVSDLHQGELENPQPTLDPSLEPPTFAEGSFPNDFAIDPSLLALSMPSTSTSSIDGSVWNSYPSSSATSPMPSCFDDLEPMTPGWDAGSVDSNSFGLLPSVDTSQGTGIGNFSLESLQGSGVVQAGPSVGVKNKGKGRAIAPRSHKSLNREVVIKLAKQRRQELTDELVRARTQLWETTIEQGVLANLAKSVR